MSCGSTGRRLSGSNVTIFCLILTIVAIDVESFVGDNVIFVRKSYLKMFVRLSVNLSVTNYQSIKPLFLFRVNGELTYEWKEWIQSTYKYSVFVPIN